MTISLGRRGFLSLLGAAPAAPLLAKKALEEQLAGATGVDLFASTSTPSLYWNCPPTAISSSGLSYEDALSAAKNYMRLFGIPEHVEHEIDERVREVRALDPDIAAKRSWSWSVKVQEQRNRNKARLRKRFEDEIAQTTRRKAFRTVAGFDWPLGF